MSVFKRGRTDPATVATKGDSPDCTELGHPLLTPMGSEVSSDAGRLSEAQVKPPAEVTTQLIALNPYGLPAGTGAAVPFPRSHSKTAHVAARSSSLYSKIPDIRAFRSASSSVSVARMNWAIAQAPPYSSCLRSNLMYFSTTFRL